MGWLALLVGKDLYNALPAPAFNLLIAGGLSYTVGAAFYAAKQYRYTHTIWHLFVLAGTVCHFFAVFWYAA